jgi:hypothetical protein
MRPSPCCSLVSAALILLAVDCCGAACDTKQVQFEEKFADLKNWPDLDAASSLASIKDGRLTLTVADGKSAGSLYRGDVFEDGDICVAFRLVKTDHKAADENGRATAAVIFWGTDWKNNYRFTFAPEDGATNFEVDRIVGGHYLNVPWSKSGAVKGVGEVNIIRVSIRGAQAKYYINDQEVQPGGPLVAHKPEGGSSIGWQVGSSSGSQYVWEISSVKVTK